MDSYFWVLTGFNINTSMTFAVDGQWGMAALVFGVAVLFGWIATVFRRTVQP